MLWTPWLTLRQVKDALRHGRLEECHRLLAPLLEAGDRRGRRLAAELSSAYIALAEKALRADDIDEAWSRLVMAESLNAGDSQAARLRHALVRVGIAEARAALEAGRPAHAAKTIERLQERAVRHADLEPIENAALEWMQASEMADRGEFPQAIATLAKTRNWLGNIPAAGFDKFLAALDDRRARFDLAAAGFAEAKASGDLPALRDWAARLLEAAPAHREARDAQFRAWNAQPVTAPYIAGETKYYNPNADSTVAPKHDTLPKRFLLWIDGVGGYLVCLGHRVSFGQAAAEGPVDIPLLADVSRLHAELHRDGEGYLVESARGMLVNSQPSAKAALRHGDRVTLGDTCQFVFHRPVEISPSARLELVSGHRLQIAVDGVLLMAESIVLGPSSQSHVVVPWLDDAVLLYRSKEGLGVRMKGEFRVDGRPELNRAALALPAVVWSDQFQFAVEPLPEKLTRRS